jgi:hypothetical protein
VVTDAVKHNPAAAAAEHEVQDEDDDEDEDEDEDEVGPAGRWAVAGMGGPEGGGVPIPRVRSFRSGGGV